MNRFTAFIKRRKSVIFYFIFGGITTTLNILVYHMFYYTLQFSNVVSNVIAWFIAKVMVAFWTNKFFVFESKAASKKGVVGEFFSFMGCRIATGLLDLGIMFIAVDYLKQNGVFWKVITNILIIILNYITGKCIVFRKKK